MSGGTTFDFVTIGETMAAFVRDAATGGYVMTPVGAESNVAAGMAQLGCRTRWISRLGDDELGRSVADFVVSHGVDACVEWDPARVTGACVKEVRPGGTRMRYYRSHSAARLLGADQLRHAGPARWLHVTGITPALSPSGADLVEAALRRVGGQAERVSMDVNYRPALWAGPDDAARVLVPLARLADTVFIGDDEARALLGSSAEAVVRDALLVRPDQEIVLKRGPEAATVITTRGTVTEPAHRVDVVDVVGAGDAFAAGYIAAACRGGELDERLRLGHALAARVVGVIADLAPTLERSETERLVASCRTPQNDGERSA